MNIHIVRNVGRPQSSAGGQVVETAPGEAAEEPKRVPALCSATVSLVLSHIKEVNSECGLNM